ncbi:hypothetical protein [Brevibacillus reuszeri]|uniref:hypothetical protein n=1 Tax=Brevibacillus reuszeri TaxID=54915 RepID=UPI0013E065EC|nr:hypothetical protein [Brevibacillus reuszeri]
MGPLRSSEARQRRTLRSDRHDYFPTTKRHRPLDPPSERPPNQWRQKVGGVSPEFADALNKTVPVHSANSFYHALKATIRLYRNLRDRISGIKRKEDAEQAAVAYLDKVYSSLPR